MRNIKNKFIYLIILILLSSTAVIPQNREEQRKKEHEAVEQYLNNAMLNAKQGNQNGESKGNQRLKKTSAFVEGEKSFLMNGNNVSVELFNYGGIAPGYPSGNFRSIGNLNWRKLPYIFQFCPIVGASVPDNEDPNKRLLYNKRWII
jgi:hypothetical protein